MTGPSTIPVIYVEIGFGKGPFDDDPGTIVPDHPPVKKIHTRSGRTNELEATPPGQASITIDNHDRHYDPFDTAGPHYGDLLPNRPVTVYVTQAGADIPIWSGFTEEWPQSYQPPETADIDLPCVDALGVLARTVIPDSVWAAAIKEAEPLAWYRLNEVVPHVLYDSSGNGYHGGFGPGGTGWHPLHAPGGGGYHNGLDSSCTGLLTGDTDTAVDFHPSIHIGVCDWPILNARDSSDDPWERTYEFWWKGEILVDANSSGLGVSNKINEFRLVSVGTGVVPNDNSLEIIYDDFTGLTVRTRDGTEQAASLEDYPPSVRHHVVVYHPASDDSTDLILYVDGEAATTNTYARTPTPGSTDPDNPYMVDKLIGANCLQLSDGIGAVDGSIPTMVMLDEVTVYDRELDAGEVADHYLAGSNPWYGDDPITRLNNILAAARLTAWQTAASPLTDWFFGPASTAGVNVLEYVQRIEATESGRLIPRPDGIDLLPREEYPDPLSVAAVFTDDPSGDYHYDEVEFDTGTTLLRNSITVKYEPSGDLIISPPPSLVAGQVTLNDDASVLLYGRRPYEITTLVTNYVDARLICLDLLNRHSDPTPRVTKLVITPSADSRLIEPATNLKLGDRVEVTRHPQGIGDPFTLACHIDGIEHDIDSGVDLWRVTYYLSAAATV